VSQSLLERGLEEWKGFLRGFEIEGFGLGLGLGGGGGGGVVLRMRGLEGRRKGREAELLLESRGGFKEKEMNVAGEREKEEGLWLECKGKCDEVDNEKLKASIVIVYCSRECYYFILSSWWNGV